jgi:hypothetical protein
MVLEIGLLCMSAHRDCHGLGRDQLIGETCQHAPLDVVTANGAAILANPFAEMTEAAVTVIDDDTVFAAAASADEQAR